MEGVIDYRMRHILTAVGGYDRCVTEFIRVSDRPTPARVFFRLCPELGHGGRTLSGTPVFLQLLGGDPLLMAQSARIAVAEGAPGIDLNFGCPAKTVNRRDGGSVLLREPHRVGAIVKAVRDVVDPGIPVCAKIRLGFDHCDLLNEIVEQVHAAGATELCIHARTRTDGYKPPAHWHRIGVLPRFDDMEIIVNGEIWGVGDAATAMKQSGCRHLMIGRGGLARPDLPRILRSALETEGVRGWKPLAWPDVARLVERFFLHRNRTSQRYVGNRTKQWLGYLLKQYPEAASLFRDIRKLRDHDSIASRLALASKRLPGITHCENIDGNAATLAADRHHREPGGGRTGDRVIAVS